MIAMRRIPMSLLRKGPQNLRHFLTKGELLERHQWLHLLEAAKDSEHRGRLILVKEAEERERMRLVVVEEAAAQEKVAGK